MENQIDSAEDHIRAARVVDVAIASAVRRLLDTSAERLASVQPQAFLHDATTKNVLVHNGSVSGLVDVDTMAFGDPLWAVALTQMSLVSAGRSTQYTNELASAMGRSDDAELLDLYSRVFCLSFLGELGQTFNQDRAAPIDTRLQSASKPSFNRTKS